MAVYRFGSFELQSTSAELRRQGVRVRLRPQPCAVLAYLVERPGQFVSRQELRAHLWPQGTFVHFDQGLNSCVKQLRAALGDQSRHPRFVETLTRRGYRFIAPVSRVEGSSPAAAYRLTHHPKRFSGTADYTITGTARVQGGVVHITARLVRSMSRLVLAAIHEDAERLEVSRPAGSGNEARRTS